MALSQTVSSEPSFGFGFAPGMDGNVRIRNATITDAAFVCRLQVEAFEGKMTAAVGRERLEPLIAAMEEDFAAQSVSFHRMFIAECDGKPAGLALINFHDDHKEMENSNESAYQRRLGCCPMLRFGCLMLRLESPPPKEGECYLSVLCVDSAVRGKGIGKVLLDRCDWEAKRHGCSMISLLVTANNRASNLYERHGYRVISTKDFGCCVRNLAGVSQFKRMEKLF